MKITPTCPSDAAPCDVELLTALAPGGIAVIRLSGRRCAELLARTCRRLKSDAPPEFAVGRLTHCRLMEGDETLDEVVIALCEAGDNAEICLHGGVRVVQRGLMLFDHLGCRRTARGRRAKAAANANPLPEEALGWIDNALPLAATRRMARWLLRQRALLPTFLERLAGRRQPPVDEIERLEFELRSAIGARLLRGLRIALIGPPNAGKSTLANTMIGRERVITSDTPGTTRDWVDETAIINGWPVTLTDTAGLRSTPDPLEAAAIERGLAQAGAAELVLVVLDVTRVVAEPKRALEAVSHLTNSAVSGPPIIVLNKCDLTLDRPAALHGRSAVCVSALSGDGISELESRIENDLGLSMLDGIHPSAPMELAR